jgi:sulfatase maturation enzyme AslB (radical SAM superfamily)
MNNNEFEAKRNFLKAVHLKNESKELSKDLKVKIVRLRLTYNELHNEIAHKINTYVDNLVSDEIRELHNKKEEELTEEEKQKVIEASNVYSKAYGDYLKKISEEESSYKGDDIFTEDEFNDIIDINACEEFEVAGQKLSLEDFMQAFHSLFVK